MNLIDSLIQDGWLKTPRIIKAFREIKRVDFMPEDIKHLAELNEALPIGYGQTISQPLVVAFMIEQLSPEPGDKILDIGSGSGWTTAILAQIVGQNRDFNNQISNTKQAVLNSKQTFKGKVIAIELIPELKKFGEKNAAKYNFVDKGIAEFICGDGSKGYKKEAPYNRILASASAEEISESWKEQLKVGGIIVAPVGDSILVLKKKSEIQFEEIEHRGFVFVPLIQERR